jgi:hypothetical protein
MQELWIVVAWQHNFSFGGVLCPGYEDQVVFSGTKEVCRSQCSALEEASRASKGRTLQEAYVKNTSYSIRRSRTQPR